jgi:hypothetical protein
MLGARREGAPGAARLDQKAIIPVSPAHQRWLARQRPSNAQRVATPSDTHHPHTHASPPTLDVTMVEKSFWGTIPLPSPPHKCPA